MCLGTLRLAGNGRMSGSDAYSPLTQDISGKKTLRVFTSYRPRRLPVVLRKIKRQFQCFLNSWGPVESLMGQPAVQMETSQFFGSQNLDTQYLIQKLNYFLELYKTLTILFYLFIFYKTPSLL